MSRIRQFVNSLAERLVEVDLVDRAVALGSQAFVALIPLLIVTAAFLPRSNRGGFAVALIERFELKGASAAAVERVFAQPASVRDTLSVLGALLLVVSGLSFCRALQRLYERTWRLPALGISATPAHLRWIAVVIAYVAVMGAVNAVVSEWFDTGAKVAIGLAGGFLLWLLTPFLLLGRRVAPRALLWTALLTSVSMSALSAASVLYMPRSIASSAERFGPIGIAISLVSWLIAAGFVLAVAAVVGAILAEGSAGGRAGSSERRVTPPAGTD